jgi:protein TonB
MKDFLASTILGLILLFAMLGKTNTTFAFIPSVDNLYSNVTDTVPTQESKVMELEEKQKKWIYKHLKYPKEAQDNNIQGRVIVRFFVKTDGSISDVEVVRPVHPLLDKEAVRVIKSMPKFKPTTQNGKPVNGTYVMTVPFQLF